MKNTEYKVGQKVLVTEEGQTATIMSIHADGDLYLKFEDGDEGSYGPGEVEHAE